MVCVTTIEVSEDSVAFELNEQGFVQIEILVWNVELRKLEFTWLKSLHVDS